jgi:hypothetical protein
MNTDKNEEFFGHGLTLMNTDKKEENALDLSVQIRAIRVIRVLRFLGLLDLSVRIRPIRAIRVQRFLALSVQSVFQETLNIRRINNEASGINRDHY